MDLLDLCIPAGLTVEIMASHTSRVNGAATTYAPAFGLSLDDQLETTSGGNGQVSANTNVGFFWRGTFEE